MLQLQGQKVVTAPQQCQFNPFILGKLQKKTEN